MEVKVNIKVFLVKCIEVFSISLVDEAITNVFSDDKVVFDTLELYELFRDIESLDKKRENEFRKGVNLKLIYKGQTININLNQLKEYAEILERFISYLK